MDDILDDFNEFDSSVHEGNVFSKILSKPRATFNFIFAKKPDLFVPQLLIAGAVLGAINNNTSIFYYFSLLSVLTLLFSAALTFVLYYIFAWAIRSTGTWLGGKTTDRKCRTVLAWSLVPTFGNIVILIIQLAISKGDVLVDNYAALELIYVILNWTTIIFSLWSLVITVIGISVIQNFSYFKAFINLLIPILIIALIGFSFILYLLFKS